MNKKQYFLRSFRFYDVAMRLYLVLLECASVKMSKNLRIQVHVLLEIDLYSKICSRVVSYCLQINLFYWKKFNNTNNNNNNN